MNGALRAGAALGFKGARGEPGRRQGPSAAPLNSGWRCQLQPEKTHRDARAVRRAGAGVGGFGVVRWGPGSDVLDRSFSSIQVVKSRLR